MKFTQHHSSSTGNLYSVTGVGGQRILIECGVRWPVLLESLEFDLSNIKCCLVTHEHKDHCQAVKKVAENGINVYASPGTVEAMGMRGARRVNPIDVGQVSTIGGFKVFPFSVHHDSAEPVGYFIYETETGRTLLFATDTTHIKMRWKRPLTVAAIECSYDRDVLQTRVSTGDINESLAKRLWQSHMECHVTKRYLMKYCDLSQCEEIHLLHMSDENLNKKQVRDDIQGTLFVETIYHGFDKE